ncbi:MAG: hypothetical protein J0M18_00795 [Ignavibacteria bacterium]|jgi:hypothetical protein|nr:hypothetical protein [Ignavibacteria bacterium]
MNDTLPYIQKKYDEMIMELPWEKRLIMATEMFDAAKELIKASLSQELSEKEKKIEVVRRLYEQDFKKEKLEKFLNSYKEYLDSTE